MAPVCEYCGCHQNEFIAELMDQHARLLDLGDTMQRQLAAGENAQALTALREFVPLLASHTGVEERGIFAALKDEGEFVEVIEGLEEEHRTLDAQLSELGDPDALRRGLDTLLADLTDHIERENRGIFPFAYSTLPETGWVTVSDAHAASEATS